MKTANPLITRLQAAVLSLDNSETRLHGAMRAAHSGGVSLREIANVVKLSHETVRTIVKEPTS